MAPAAKKSGQAGKSTVTDAAAPKAAPGQSGGAARPGWRRAAGALQVAFAVALALHVYVLRPVRVDGEPVSWVRQTPAELFAFEPTRADMSVWGPGRSPLKVRVSALAAGMSSPRRRRSRSGD